jgi:hypothetical protein
MGVNYQKLLPSSMRNTRWGQFARAYQTLIEQEIKPNSIDPIKNQYDEELMTSDECIANIISLGWQLSTYEGYTSTLEYLKKELYTITKRVLHKTTRKAYFYTYYIYNMTGDVFPLFSQIDTSLLPMTNWWIFNENFSPINTLDSGDDNILYYITNFFDTGTSFDTGSTFDTLIPVYTNPHSTGLANTTLDAADLFELDAESTIISSVRDIELFFTFDFIENISEFISTYTVKAFENDLYQTKKATEILFYTPLLIINAYLNHTEQDTTYYNYTQTISALQRSILIGTNISTAATIRFGTGSHTIINNSITDVQNYSYQVSGSNLLLTTNPIDNTPIYTKKIYPFNKMTSFSEIAVWDSGNNCLLYATFPTINFPTKIYSNFALSFNLV